MCLAHVHRGRAVLWRRRIPDCRFDDDCRVRSINPQVVQVPDGRVGCLVMRMGLAGCVEFGAQRIIETYRLDVLNYHLTLSPVRDRKMRRTSR
jgi:hypothetical protein